MKKMNNVLKTPSSMPGTQQVPNKLIMVSLNLQVPSYSV